MKKKKLREQLIIVNDMVLRLQEKLSLEACENRRLEQELKQGQDNYNKLWDMYSELKKELGNRTCKSCKHFEADMWKSNRGLCRNENTPISFQLIDCDYCYNRYEPKENK